MCIRDRGTGGDELFGGYPWRYYSVYQSLDQKAFFDNYYSFWQRLVPDNDKQKLFTADTFNRIDIAEPREVFERCLLYTSSYRIAVICVSSHSKRN